MERTQRNVNNTSANLATDNDSITSAITCPITFEKIKDPVIDPDGHTYERTAILTWLQNNHTSPITRIPLHKEQLVRNHALSKFLDIWRQQRQDEDDGYSESDCDDEKEEALMNRVLGSTCIRELLLSCPITGVLMSEPVIDPDGNTFEKSAIYMWISYNGTSPITSAQNPNRLIPNRALALLLLQYHKIDQKKEDLMGQCDLPGNTSENMQVISDTEGNSCLTSSDRATVCRKQEAADEEEGGVISVKIDGPRACIVRQSTFRLPSSPFYQLSHESFRLKRHTSRRRHHVVERKPWLKRIQQQQWQ